MVRRRYRTWIWILFIAICMLTITDGKKRRKTVDQLVQQHDHHHHHPHQRHQHHQQRRIQEDHRLLASSALLHNRSKRSYSYISVQSNTTVPTSLLRTTDNYNSFIYGQNKSNFASSAVTSEGLSVTYKNSMKTTIHGTSLPLALNSVASKAFNKVALSSLSKLKEYRMHEKSEEYAKQLADVSVKGNMIKIVENTTPIMMKAPSFAKQNQSVTTRSNETNLSFKSRKKRSIERNFESEDHTLMENSQYGQQFKLSPNYLNVKQENKVSWKKTLEDLEVPMLYNDRDGALSDDSSNTAHVRVKRIDRDFNEPYVLSPSVNFKEGYIEDLENSFPREFRDADELVELEKRHAGAKAVLISQFTSSNSTRSEDWISAENSASTIAFQTNFHDTSHQTQLDQNTQSVNTLMNTESTLNEDEWVAVDTNTPTNIPTIRHETAATTVEQGLAEVSTTKTFVPESFTECPSCTERSENATSTSAKKTSSEVAETKGNSLSGNREVEEHREASTIEKPLLTSLKTNDDQKANSEAVILPKVFPETSKILENTKLAEILSRKKRHNHVKKISSESYPDYRHIASQQFDEKSDDVLQRGVDLNYQDDNKVIDSVLSKVNYDVQQDEKLPIEKRWDKYKRSGRPTGDLRRKAVHGKKKHLIKQRVGRKPKKRKPHGKRRRSNAFLQRDKTSNTVKNNLQKVIDEYQVESKIEKRDSSDAKSEVDIAKRDVAACNEENTQADQMPINKNEEMTSLNHKKFQRKQDLVKKLMDTKEDSSNSGEIEISKLQNVLNDKRLNEQSRSEDNTYELIRDENIKEGPVSAKATENLMYPDNNRVNANLKNNQKISEPLMKRNINSRLDVQESRSDLASKVNTDEKVEEINRDARSIVEENHLSEMNSGNSNPFEERNKRSLQGKQVLADDERLPLRVNRRSPKSRIKRNESITKTSKDKNKVHEPYETQVAAPVVAVQDKDRIIVERSRDDRAVKSIEEIKQLAEKLVSKVNELQNYLMNFDNQEPQTRQKRVEPQKVITPSDGVNVEEEVVLGEPKLVDECVRIGDLNTAIRTLNDQNIVNATSSVNLNKEKYTAEAANSSSNAGTMNRRIARSRIKRKPRRKWGRWTAWSSCSVTCGKGRQIRWRHCLHDCAKVETEMEEKTCQLPACPPGKFLGIF